MWLYEKRLQFPVNIQNKNARLAKAIVSQLGGPDGELAASMRYFAQRYAMPDRRVAGLLNDVATEELAHLEMIGTIIRQLTKGLSAEELKQQGFDDYYDEHEYVGIGAEARSPELFMLDDKHENDEHTWKVRQIIDDSDGDHDWAIEGIVDLDATQDTGEVVFHDYKVSN